MDRNNAMYQEHYNMPLPSIENFAYSEHNNVAEQEQVHNQHHYNYEYPRMGVYGYRNFPDHAFQVPGQHFQNYPQQIDTGQHVPLCNTMYQQGWAGYEDPAMLHNIADMGQGDGMSRARHKRSRMSLQKRLLVNARERERMRVLNKAFEALRDALPCYIADGHMAKITTLRLAINYIKALTEVLEEQREIDLLKEKIGEERNDEKLSLSNLKIMEIDDTDSKNDLVEEDVVKIETLKLDDKLRDNP